MSSSPPTVQSPGARGPRDARFDAVMVAALLGAYALTSAGTLQGADNGEWVRLMHHGGTAHPPGYPLYTLLLRAWNLLPLPVETPRRAAWLSAVLLALAAWVLARALWERNGHPFTARIATVAFALSWPAWRAAGVAEVAPLAALNAAGVLWASFYVENEEDLQPWHGALLGALYGVGVAHHHSVAALLPLTLFHVIRGHRGATARAWAAALLAGALAGIAVVAGSWTLLLTLPAGPRALRWADISSAGDVWGLILRRDYGTLASSRLSGGWSLRPVWELVLDLLRSFHLLVPLGLAALQKPRGWAVFIPWLLCGPLLLGTFTVASPDGSALAAPLEIRERFHVLPMLLFAVMVHDALASLAYQLPRLRRTVFLRAQLFLLFLAMGVAAAVALPTVSWRGETATETTLRAAVRSVPRGAVVVVGGDAWAPAFELTADREGLLPDAFTVLPWPRGLLVGDPRPEVRALVQAVCGAPACTAERLPDALLTLADTRPVLFFPAVVAGQAMPRHTHAVEGLFARALRQQPAPAQQADALERSLGGMIAPAFAAESRSTAEGHAVAVWAMPWLVLKDAAEQRGDAATAQRCARQAQGWLQRIPRP